MSKYLCGIVGDGWRRIEGGFSRWNSSETAVRGGKNVSVVGYRELSGAQGMRHSCNRSDYKRGIDEDELSWTSHHFCLRLQQWHSLVHSMSPLSSTGIGLNHVPDDEQGSRMLVIRKIWWMFYFGLWTLLHLPIICSFQETRVSPMPFISYG